MSSIISVENLGKRYTIGHEAKGRRGGYRRLSEDLADAVKRPFRALANRLRAGQMSDVSDQQSVGEGANSGSPLPAPRSPLSEDFWALRNVSFEVHPGEVLGIIGRNGAGKSTLLKILSRITEPSEGRVRIRGRVASLLEVGTGFHPELTGRENVLLNGAILGMRRVEIRRKFDEIVTFAEVERFLDTPVKRYSSGMYVRLAFAVAAFLEPEILVVDEVLAVGDAAFQKKCLGKMGEVSRTQGRTVLFVSHNMGMIRQLCPLCVWLDSGTIREIGDSAQVIANYLREGDGTRATSEVTFQDDERKDVQLRRLRFVNTQGVTTRNFDCDHPICIELELQVHRPVKGLYGYLEIRKTDGTTVLMSDSFDSPPNPLDALHIGFHRLRLTIPSRTLGPSDYCVYLNFTSPSADAFNVDSPGVVCSFRLDDFSSRRGNNRLGFLGTLVSWDRYPQSADVVLRST